jgi:hypothetical protein
MSMMGGGPPGQGTAGATDVVSALKGITQQLAAWVKGQITSGASSGNVSASNAIGTSFTQVIASNPNRRRITFHNPGTINLYVGPMVLSSGAPNAPTLSLLAGVFIVLPGSDRIVDGACQTAWGAMASTGGANSITISES